MAKKSVGDLSRADLEGKVVFVRCDLNVSAAAARRPPPQNPIPPPRPPPAARSKSFCSPPNFVNFCSYNSQFHLRSPLQPPHHPPQLTHPSSSAPPTHTTQVPLDGTKISDDTRIRAAIPTLKYLADNGAKVVVTSHLGRPKSGPEDKFRLTPVVPRLSELLGKPVKKTNDCIGAEPKAAVAAMQNGDVLLLENVRFYPQEEKNDPAFAKVGGVWWFWGCLLGRFGGGV
jgi:hypothetical protein